MHLKRLSTIALLVVFATAAFAADQTGTTAKRFGTWGIDTSGMDTSVKPGDDFNRYVNGKWIDSTQIPADRTSYGAFPMLTELSQARVHAILAGWAADKTDRKRTRLNSSHIPLSR